MSVWCKWVNSLLMDKRRAENSEKGEEHLHPGWDLERVGGAERAAQLVVARPPDPAPVRRGGARGRVAPSIRLRSSPPRGARPDPTRKAWRGYVATLVFFDAVSALLAAAVGTAVGTAVFSGANSSWLAPGSGGEFGTVLAAATAALWVATLGIRGAYDLDHLGSGSEEYRRVLDGAVRFLALVVGAVFILDLAVGRRFVVSAIPVAAVLTLGFRYAARMWLHRQRARGRFQRRILVVGSEPAVAALADRLAGSPHAGLMVAGACVAGLPSTATGVGAAGVPVVGRPEHAVEAAQRESCEGIVVADAHSFGDGSLHHLAWQLEGTGIDLLVAPNLADVAGPRITVRPVADVPLLHLAEPELSGWRRLAKSGADRLVAAAGLVMLAPVFVVVAVAVALDSGRPVFFRQRRVGQGGYEFTIWKFRTMVPDAESRLCDLRPLSEADGPLFKMRSDPRVTRVGRPLRRWSLDELPQLLNVLKGDMSLVGPRPPLPCEVETYSPAARRRLLVKPGITGLWQVSGRSGLSWEESVRLDLHYVENWSPSLDAMILVRTLVAVVRGRGAC